MSNAKDYPNTLEFVSEAVTTTYNKQWIKHLKTFGEISKDDLQVTEWKDVPESQKEDTRKSIALVLDVIDYFENKTCNDCGYFDPETKSCFGEDREHEECAGSPICETFAPKGLVEVCE